MQISIACIKTKQKIYTQQQKTLKIRLWRAPEVNIRQYALLNEKQSIPKR